MRNQKRSNRNLLLFIIILGLSLFSVCWIIGCSDDDDDDDDNNDSHPTATPTPSSWSNTYGGTKDEFSNSGIQTKDGSYLVIGQTKSFGAGGSDAYLLKLDPMGNVLFSKTYVLRNLPQQNR